MTEDIDCAIIGAGVIGLAIARKLTSIGREVIILESAEAIGTGISSRNSEVIHGGIYYPRDSLKRRLCIRGRDMLYAYCAKHGIDHRRCGKIIVATDESQVGDLEALIEKGLANGVDDLERLSADRAIAMEPELHCVAALWSPSTGIIDSHSLMLSLLGNAEDNGAMIALNSPVTGGRVSDGGITLNVGGADPMELFCRNVFNCSGLEAQNVATSIQGMPDSLVPARYLAKGSYFYLSTPPPFSHLVYPMPTSASLGMHYTLDMGGQARFGPDLEWVDEIEYSVNPERATSFIKAIRRYWPNIADGSISPGYSGIRPKLQAPGEEACDFLIQDYNIHGIKGLINLFGIESPGLTSSLAIAEDVSEMVV